MGRLKRSCVVGSIVFHALTLALLVLAPVLLAKRVEKVKVIDLIPSEIVDQIMAPPAPVAPPSPPTPTPPKPTPPKPNPPKPKPKPPDPIPPKPKPKPVEVVKPKPKPKPVKPKIKVNLKSTMRQPDTQKVKAQQAAAERARQAEAKRQAALKQSLNKLDSKLSGRTSVNVPQGRYAAANYESLIRRKYVDATIHPGTISGDPVVKVQLVIARNGNVISARIIGVSGLASWDRAVQKALDRVKRIAPFPAGMSGAKKTFNLNFNSRSFQ
ncbi:MAG: energy transducer TonB [Limisphaerales bacterium]